MILKWVILKCNIHTHIAGSWPKHGLYEVTAAAISYNTFGPAHILYAPV